MLEKPDSFWLQRWYSLRDSISATQESAEGPFKSFLGNLLSFGANQFYYFYLGFGGEEPKSEDIFDKPDSAEYECQSRKCNDKPQKLVKDYVYPPDHILRVVIDQIAYDYEVIQRALYQRIKSPKSETEEWNDLATLQLANRWGEHLLQQVAIDVESMTGKLTERFTSLADDRDRREKLKDHLLADKTPVVDKIFNYKKAARPAGDVAPDANARPQQVVDLLRLQEMAEASPDQAIKLAKVLISLPWNKRVKLADLLSSSLDEKVTELTQFINSILEEACLVNTTPRVMTYFNRSPRIRMIPYDNVALVGIPMTTTKANQRRDLLVMGHELGHYIYWHGQIKGKPVRDALEDIVQSEEPYIKNWIEEIFADVFGIIISGELAIVPWAFNMIDDNPPILYVRDNYIHPIDAIRPYIYFLTLQLLWNHKSRAQWSVKQELKQEDETVWKTLRAMIKVRHKIKGGYEGFKAINKLGEPITVSLDKLQVTLDHIIERISYEIVEPVYNDFGLWKNKTMEEVPFHPWPLNTQRFLLNSEISTAIMEELPQGHPFFLYFMIQDISKAYERIQNWYKELETRLIDVSDATNSVDSQEITVANSNSVSRRQFMEIRDLPFEAPLQSDIWKVVFAAEGWTVKGPETWPTGDWEQDWQQNSFHL